MKSSEINLLVSNDNDNGFTGTEKRSKRPLAFIGSKCVSVKMHLHFTLAFIQYISSWPSRQIGNYMTSATMGWLEHRWPHGAI